MKKSVKELELELEFNGRENKKLRLAQSEEEMVKQLAGQLLDEVQNLGRGQTIYSSYEDSFIEAILLLKPSLKDYVKFEAVINRWNSDPSYRTSIKTMLEAAINEAYQSLVKENSHTKQLELGLFKLLNVEKIGQKILMACQYVYTEANKIISKLLNGEVEEEFLSKLQKQNNHELISAVTYLTNILKGTVKLAPEEHYFKFAAVYNVLDYDRKSELSSEFQMLINTMSKENVIKEDESKVMTDFFRVGTNARHGKIKEREDLLTEIALAKDKLDKLEQEIRLLSKQGLTFGADKVPDINEETSTDVIKKILTKLTLNIKKRETCLEAIKIKEKEFLEFATEKTREYSQYINEISETTDNSSESYSNSTQK